MLREEHVDIFDIFECNQVEIVDGIVILAKRLNVDLADYYIDI